MCHTRFLFAMIKKQCFRIVMVVIGQHTELQILCPCDVRVWSGSFVLYFHHSLDCEFLGCGKTEEEMLSKASQHAQGVHKMKEFSLDLYETARSAIREGYGWLWGRPRNDFGRLQCVLRSLFDCSDAWATDGIIGLLEKFSNAGLAFAGIHSLPVLVEGMRKNKPISLLHLHLLWKANQ